MRPAIEEAIAEVDKRDARKRDYWKGSTPALAAAEIQAAVNKIIETNNARVFSSQTLPVRNDGKAVAGPAKVSISVQMTASIVPLQLVLHAIETQQPYLFVDQLSVRSNQGRTYKAAPGQVPEYVIQLTVRGYYLPEEPRS
jgi:general secretion pathway protein M